MKRIPLILSLLVGLFFTTNAQQLYYEVYSGYERTAYEHQDYNSPEGNVPIGVRVAGGLEHVQLGVQYQQQITNPSFSITEETTGLELGRNEFDTKYYGLFLRGNLSSLPAYRFGLVLMAGAGYYNTKVETYVLDDDKPSTTVEYDKKLGYNARIGVSAPIYTFLHWSIGYQFNYIERDELTAPYAFDAYKAFHHSFQMGLSMNMVFGNTQKKCRRVMSSPNRGRRR